ncbi:hypothetical protein Cco03nite_83010 [Catellatospora coxensis]|uniref:Uncharacterized protein n=1 Tax=Catellatospora coxensis TaxID=310354 RepID=A0A8J3LAQ7_9ACTN|nr:hypothetical protein Cco03nite_83010 [Catellatospora coxensis]
MGRNGTLRAVVTTTVSIIDRSSFSVFSKITCTLRAVGPHRPQAGPPIPVALRVPPGARSRKDERER